MKQAMNTLIKAAIEQGRELARADGSCKMVGYETPTLKAFNAAKNAARIELEKLEAMEVERGFEVERLNNALRTANDVLAVRALQAEQSEVWIQAFCAAMGNPRLKSKTDALKIADDTVEHFAEKFQTAQPGGSENEKSGDGNNMMFAVVVRTTLDELPITITANRAEALNRAHNINKTEIDHAAKIMAVDSASVVCSALITFNNGIPMDVEICDDLECAYPTEGGAL